MLKSTGTNSQRPRECISDALQQDWEQVAQTYFEFEIWVVEVGIGVKNDSSIEFET